MYIPALFLLWLAALDAVTITAAPLVHRDLVICSEIKTCSACVQRKGLCSFDLATHHCVPGGTGNSLTNDTKKCQGIPPPQELGQPTAGQRAKAASMFAVISSHVLQGETRKGSSGRHLTSAWLKNHAGDAQKFNIDRATSLASLAEPLKTLWVDDVIERGSGNKKVVEFQGKYTEADVSRICTDAIAWSLFHDASVGKAVGPSYSVASFAGGPNICVTVTTASCYPAGITQTSKAIGEECP